jgi:hypothetical protein
MTALDAEPAPLRNPGGSMPGPCLDADADVLRERSSGYRPVKEPCNRKTLRSRNSTAALAKLPFALFIILLIFGLPPVAWLAAQ